MFSKIMFLSVAVKIVTLKAIYKKSGNIIYIDQLNIMISIQHIHHAEHDQKIKQI